MTSISAAAADSLNPVESYVLRERAIDDDELARLKAENAALRVECDRHRAARKVAEAAEMAHATRAAALERRLARCEEWANRRVIVARAETERPEGKP